MESVKSWIRKLSSYDHRRGQRLASPMLVAYYWDGSVPMAHEIQNISSTGFYLLTDERWHLGTVVTMTLQRTDIEDAKNHPEGYITVPSKVIRLGTDGVAFEFVPLSDKASSDTNGRTRGLTGRKAMGKFIESLKSDQGHAMIGCIATDLEPKLMVRDSVLVMPRRNAMKRLKDENGQALIITALCMTCFFGFMALAADVGIMLREKRLVQSAADSAAIAGALEVNLDPTNVSTAAQAAATQNGFTSGSSGATVTVNSPPLFGPHASQANAVEVIVSQSQPALFMGFFGISSMSPTARAVAVNGGAANGCVFITSSNASPAFNLQGSFDVTTPNCGIIVNSNAAGALNFTGAGGTLTAGSVGVAGTCTGHCSDSTPAPVTGIVPVSDPLAKLDPSFPVPTGCIAGGTLTGSPAAGCYSGDASGNLTLSNVTLTGMYVFTGSGTVTLSGTIQTGTGGATLDLNSGSLTESTNTTIAWTAPSTGTFAQIAIMAPPTNTTGTLAFAIGDATGTLQGIIYAPGMAMTMQDHGGSGKKGGLSLTTDLIVNTLSDTSALLNLTSLTQTVPGSPLTRVTLVE
jgi:Putative Tad-like Flp pilus-assembly